MDDVDSWQGLEDSDLEAQSKPQIKPYRRAAPDHDHVKVFIHGHLRGLSETCHVLPVYIHTYSGVGFGGIAR